MSTPVTTERRDGFPVGWYGKIPAAGDFIARRIAPAFSHAWDHWLQNALGASRDRLASRWPGDFLSMPVWRFVFAPGLVGAGAWAGLMLPSVDAVGRYFPLALASSLSSVRLDLVGTLFAARKWFEEMEDIALSAIAPRADFEPLDAAVRARPFRGEWIRYPERRNDARSIRSASPKMLCFELADTGDCGGDGEAGVAALGIFAERLSTPCAVWLAEASDVFGRAALLCEALPSAEQLCAMMDGRWLDHGWTRQEVPPVR